MNRKAILALLVSALLIAGVNLWAQTRRDPSAITSSPVVLFGDDVGVRITGPVGSDGRLPGRVVVKINDRWVEVASPMAVTDITR
jgi:hypothetical protein